MARLKGLDAVSLREVARQAGVFDGRGPALLRLQRRDAYLPHDPQSKADARITLAFVGHGAVQPTLTKAAQRMFTGFRQTLQSLLAASGAALDASTEALHLAALLDGLRYAVLLGELPHQTALAAVTRHLDQIGIRPGTASRSDSAQRELSRDR